MYHEQWDFNAYPQHLMAMPCFLHDKWGFLTLLELNCQSSQQETFILNRTRT